MQATNECLLPLYSTTKIGYKKEFITSAYILLSNFHAMYPVIMSHSTSSSALFPAHIISLSRPRLASDFTPPSIAYQIIGLESSAQGPISLNFFRDLANK